MDLIDLEVIKDPYYRIQNTEVLWVADGDWEYQLVFSIDINRVDKSLPLIRD